MLNPMAGVYIGQFLEPYAVSAICLRIFPTSPKQIKATKWHLFTDRTRRACLLAAFIYFVHLGAGAAHSRRNITLYHVKLQWRIYEKPTSR